MKATTRAVKFAEASLKRDADDRPAPSDNAKRARPNPFVSLASRGTKRTTFDAKILSIAQLFDGSAAHSHPGVFRAPLFQRRYCWGVSHWATFMKDVGAMRNEAVNAVGAEECSTYDFPAPHSLGNLLLVRPRGKQHDEGGAVAGTNTGAGAGACAGAGEGTGACGRGAARSPEASAQECLCVDGQQRITSVLLFLAALRDVALGLVSRTSHIAGAIEDVALQGGGNSARVAQAVASLRNTQGVATRALFSRESAACRLGSLSLDGEDLVVPAQSTKSTHEDTASSTVGLRWTPTHLDVDAFVAAMRANACDPAASPAQSTGGHRVSAAKTFFTRAISRHLARRRVLAAAKAAVEVPAPRAGMAAGAGDLCADAIEMAALLHAVLHGMSVVGLFMRTGHPQDVFESWARGKEVGHAFFPLHVPRSGRSLASSDLVRNLVMSLFKMAPDRQLEVYKDVWVPMEQAVLAIGRERGVGAFGDVAAVGEGGVVPTFKLPGVSDASGSDGEDEEEAGKTHSEDSDTAEEEDFGVHFDDEEQSGAYLDAFFMAFLRRCWGVKDLQSVPGLVVVHKSLSIAYPAFSTELRRRLFEFGGDGESGALATAANPLGGCVLSDDLAARKAQFGETVVRELVAFSKDVA